MRMYICDLFCFEATMDECTKNITRNIYTFMNIGRQIRHLSQVEGKPQNS